VVQAVAGVPAGSARVFVAGVVLDVAQRDTGIQGESDCRMAQAVRRELPPRADPGDTGEAPHQLPKVPLAEPPAGVGGQQRPGQVPLVGRSGSLRAVGQIGLQGRCGWRG
jgi:hypothetical protein